MTPMHPDYPTWPLAEQLRYTRMRWVWPIRDELTPNGEKVNGVTKQVTWATWFQIRHGISLDQYVSDFQMKYQREAA